MVEGCPFLDRYVLVGGSALSLHLCHRMSEDLDFFTYEDDFDKQAIFAYLQTFDRKEILSQSDEQIDVLLDGIKVTFFNAKWAFLKPERIQPFNLASVESIAAMKVNVLFLRAKYRDYYDLYFLVKKRMSLKKMFACSLDILEGINFKLFVTALLYTEDIEDDTIEYLEPVEKVSREQIRDYFEQRLNR
jgi:predicted nucleotidyltransferase component of viral defense system